MQTCTENVEEGCSMFENARQLSDTREKRESITDETCTFPNSHSHVFCYKYSQ